MNNMKSTGLPKAGHGGYSSLAPNNQSLLLDKLNVRRSTPDSEALASSDDEPDHRQDTTHNSVHHQKPVRRASWLNDPSQANIAPARKSSFASSTMSPTASHPSTPSAETGANMWGSHAAHTSTMGRSHQAPATFTWGTGIWNTERSKDPPSRLTEVLQSPTSTAPPGLVTGGSFGTETSYSQISPGPREVGPNPQIPFAIPLHPTPKTYRSQSYSVGQLEPDTGNGALPGPSHLPGRGRHIGPSGLQHRPSRPSMLSEMSNEGMLGKVHEVEDDDVQSTHSSGQGTQTHQADQSKTIELLARENAMLRQQQQYQNLRHRPRASTSYGIGNGYSVRDPVPEESDYAVDELDEGGDSHDAAAKRALGRRMSELGTGSFGARSPLYPVENRKLENVKKAYWQSSLGFGGMGDTPQSRRHSFADVPTRQGSISSVGGADGATLQELGSPDNAHPQDFGGYADSAGFGAANTMSYFTGGSGMPNNQQAIASSAYANPYASYGIPPALSNRPPSPHRNMYGMGQPRHNQLLHIVLFKCSRADVFYIQEGTGLTVKPGDLVIVEADRGTDLGTVDRSNVDWQTAKELKEHYAEEHYKWLMMYSQNAAAAQEGNGAGLMAAANGMQGGAIGGMGPPSQHHMPEPGAGELKPKLIKRLAQSHEIHNLREKEGNEAKAKRVCMQKVKEHGLNMEILDAEFQMDWKKLTFYYFADAYINFNSLVTDLFKIYKTRIWMSAINPASFASPTSGLQAPSGIGPGAVGIGRGSNNAGNAERRQGQPQEPQTSFSGANSGRSYQSPFGQGYGADRSVVSSNAYPSTGFPMSGYGAFGLGSRTNTSPYVTGMVPGGDAYGGGFSQGSDFSSMRARYPIQHDASNPQDSAVSAASGQNDWAGAFQSLSLNSR